MEDGRGRLKIEDGIYIEDIFVYLYICVFVASLFSIF
jgi:hypothetical protein